jgi:hypothetical protein
MHSDCNFPLSEGLHSPDSFSLEAARQKLWISKSGSKELPEKLGFEEWQEFFCCS